MNDLELAADRLESADMMLRILLGRMGGSIEITPAEVLNAQGTSIESSIDPETLNFKIWLVSHSSGVPS